MLRYAVVVFVTFFSLNAFPSDSTRSDLQKLKYAISLAGKYSYPGYSIALAFEIERGAHVFILGPVFMISDFYVPGEMTTGVQCGWQWNLHDYSTDRSLSSFCTLDYQLVPFKVHIRFLNKHQINYLHDINLGYGIKYHLTSDIVILNSISSGIYVEAFYNSYTKKHEKITGVDLLIRLAVSYSFND